MSQITDKRLREIEEKARRKAALLSREIINSDSADKEAIYAGIEIENQIADICSNLQEDDFP